MNNPGYLLRNPSMVFLTIIAIALAVVVIAIVVWVKKQERYDEADPIGPCCRYCAYWFKECGVSRGKCEKRSKKKSPFYSAPNYCCVDYDGFVPKEKDHG